MTTIGLKDHQIAQLVNAVRDSLIDKPLFRDYGPLRDVIMRGVVRYLEENNLRIDRITLTESKCRWKE